VVEEEDENIIEIRKDSFIPKEKTIEEGTLVEWIKKDERDYQIACYLGGNRVTLSPSLKEDESFTYVFSKKGTYTCITTPYGLRNIINVLEKGALMSPTGGAVSFESKDLSRGGLAGALLVGIAILLFFIYRKRNITRSSSRDNYRYDRYSLQRF